MGRYYESSKGAEVALKHDQLLQIFKKHDTNNDGLLCREELTKAFKELGAYFPGFRANRGIRCADGNNDGFIDKGELEELVNYASKHGYTVK